MTQLLAGAAAVALALAARTPAQERPLVGRAYPSAAAAVATALASRPAIVAFGEFHQTTATAHIRSALRRFTDDILPALAPSHPAAAGAVSHLVVETWVATGGCGQTERQVTAEVEKTTDRPAATEGEIVTLLRGAASRGVIPRILSMSCADYEAMRPAVAAAPPAGIPAAPEVDFDRTLRLTRAALEAAALSALSARRDLLEKRGISSPAGAGAVEPAVALYGGALHNDLHVEPELAPYSFASALMAATLGRYVEIDLVVPEYAALSSTLRAQPWWPVFRRVHHNAAAPSAVVMIRRSSRSFVIVFPETKTHKTTTTTTTTTTRATTPARAAAHAR